MFSQYLKNGASTIQQILTEHRLWVRHCFRLSVNNTNPIPPPPKADDNDRDCFFVIFLRYKYLHQKQYILLPLLFTPDFEYEVKVHRALEQDKHLVPAENRQDIYLCLPPSPQDSPCLSPVCALGPQAPLTELSEGPSSYSVLYPGTGQPLSQPSGHSNHWFEIDTPCPRMSPS